MGNKFYGIRKGKKTGIFLNWDECKAQVTGFTGAEYKSFTNRKDAEEYINNSNESGQQIIGSKISSTQAVAYVDGSYNVETHEFSCGGILLFNGQEHTFSEKYSDEDLADMRNVAGEIKGSEKAIQFALDNDIKELAIYHDYEGISKWCTGEWQAKKEGTKAYKAFYESAKNKVKIRFVKVKGHSGDKYNEVADKLAKHAFAKTTTEEIVNMAKGSVFIERDIKKLDSIIEEIGSKEWNDFKAEKLVQVGNPYRCKFTAENKNAILDFYFKIDGTTTLSPTGTNKELSIKLKESLEDQSAYKDSSTAKSYKLTISGEWADKLVNYMRSLDGINESHTKHDSPKYDSYKFISTIGDKITFNIYETGTLLIQGKPAYLYSEALSFLSYCPVVTIDDILASNNSFNGTNIKIEDVRKEMAQAMPKAYGNIDETIWKLLSPSFSLIKRNDNLEDYSCYAFPALRALEGYLKYIFGLKNVTLDDKQNFGTIFIPDPITGLHTLNNKYKTYIADPKIQAAVEEVYNYFKTSRHVIFHVSQILISSKLLERKQEAEDIINAVIEIIERTYTNITS